MPKGGARAGAGRKKGGTNQRTRELREAVAVGGELPLDYMLRVMRDPTADHSRRDDLSKAAAPYLHSRLSTVEVSGKGGGPVQVSWKQAPPDA